MKKSVLIFFAVIAAASALHLPVDVKAALGKLHVIPIKDARYESEAMADVIPEVAQEEVQSYESEQMADPIYETKELDDTPYETIGMKEVYEHEAMVDEVEAVAEVAYESKSMADDDSEDTLSYESEQMADPVYETKEMADTPYETIAMTDDVKAVPEIASEKKVDVPPYVPLLHVPQPPIVLSDVVGKVYNVLDSKAAIVPEVPQQEDVVQTYESEQMAEPVYETKDMADTPYETVAMKEEYEIEAMADEVKGAALINEIKAAAESMISVMRKTYAESKLAVSSRFQAQKSDQ